MVGYESHWMNPIWLVFLKKEKICAYRGDPRDVHAQRSSKRVAIYRPRREGSEETCPTGIFFFFWLPWDFVDVHGLSLVVASGCYSLALCRASHCGSSSCCRARALGCGSVVVGRRLSCSSVCGILQDQGWARVPCTGGRIPNHWTAREILLRASRSWISRLRNWEKINSI